ncbi:MAG: phosphate ABC transporter permease PstA [Bacteroidales bacterium]|nr:phosphate ABC transporter permease PstA [Bacteroidales bacterium]
MQVSISHKKLDLRRVLKDRIFYIGVIVLSGITVLPLILILYKLVREGISQINFDFFTRVAPNTLEAMVAVANNETIPGGIANGIVGTLLMVALASLMAVPVGVLTGVYLSENPESRFAGTVRTIADILQGVPSIVLGVIAYMWVVRHITNGYSALAGSTSLSIMMLPLIIRSTEETLKMIPETYKEAAFALGVPYHKVLFKVLIPSGLSGLLTGILLAVSRIIGETAPLMLTALGSSRINLNIAQPTSAVPLLIWEFYNDPNMVKLIWSSSLFLMGFVLFFNILAKRISKRWKI